MLLECDGGASGKGIGVLVKLFDEEGPPFVERSDSVVSWLDFGNVGGSDEVEEEVRKEHGFCGPLSSVKESKHVWCDVVVELFTASDGVDDLEEAWLVVYGLRFGEWFGRGGAGILKDPSLLVEVGESDLAAVEGL